MGFRYRKTINFGPFRLNASKSGLGWSVGVPGARYTKMANGRTRITTGIPGTGISWVEETKKSNIEPQITSAAVDKPTEKKHIWEKTADELTGKECFLLFLWDVVKWTFLGLLMLAGAVCVIGLLAIPFLEGISKGE